MKLGGGKKERKRREITKGEAQIKKRQEKKVKARIQSCDTSRMRMRHDQEGLLGASWCCFATRTGFHALREQPSNQLGQNSE